MIVNRTTNLLENYNLTKSAHSTGIHSVRMRELVINVQFIFSALKIAYIYIKPLPQHMVCMLVKMMIFFCSCLGQC